MGEGGRAAGDALTLVITPPLDAPATVEIVAVGVETDAVNLSANEENNSRVTRDNPIPIGKDFHKVQEVQQRAGAETVVNGARSGKSEQRFLIPHLIDDLVVEPEEKFKLQLRPRVGDPFVVASETADGHAESTVTVTDNDTTTFTVETNPTGRLARNTLVFVNGLLSAPIQIESGDNLEVTEARGSYGVTFFDTNSDGYLSGAELFRKDPAGSEVNALLRDGHYRFNFTRPGLTLTQIDEDGVILLPKRGDPGRAHLPWHSDVRFQLPRIAPRHASPDFSATPTVGTTFFAGVIRVNEAAPRPPAPRIRRGRQ